MFPTIIPSTLLQCLRLNQYFILEKVIKLKIKMAENYGAKVLFASVIGTRKLFLVVKVDFVHVKINFYHIYIFKMYNFPFQERTLLRNLRSMLLKKAL